MSKQMIRHCYNCKWIGGSCFGERKCEVRYQWIDSPRLRALTCRFYEQKEVKEDEC